MFITKLLASLFVQNTQKSCANQGIDMDVVDSDGNSMTGGGATICC